jgi:hypothetical protein
MQYLVLSVMRGVGYVEATPQLCGAEVVTTSRGLVNFSPGTQTLHLHTPAHVSDAFLIQFNDDTLRLNF